MVTVLILSVTVVLVIPACLWIFGIFDSHPIQAAPKPFFSSFAGAVAIGVVYGLIARAIFGLPGLLAGSAAFIVSVSFLFLIPFAMGAIVMRLAPEALRKSLLAAITLPWVPSGLCLGGMFLTRFEGSICVVMAFPCFLLMSTFGGLSMRAVEERARNRGQKNAWAIAFSLFPILTSPLESAMPVSRQTVDVANAIRIRAAAPRVWQEIRSVRKIEESEQSWALVHEIGFPRPLEATLNGEGVGSYRRAVFERGLVFHETVTLWEPEHALGFGIRAESVPEGALDEHLRIGGRFFDVLDGKYELEAKPGGELMLHLSSRHRISTTFNPYGVLWTRWVMSAIQQHILEIIRARAES